MIRRTEPSANANHVRIGCAYIPRQRVRMDADAYQLQAALLERREYRRPSTFSLVLRSMWAWC